MAASINGGALEHAQEMAAHESPRTTKLYDRTGNEITLDGALERVSNEFQHAPVGSVAAIVAILDVGWRVIGGESGTASDFAAFRKHFRPGSVFIHGYAASEVGSIAQLRLTHDDPIPKGRLPVGLPFEGLKVSVEGDEDKTVAP